MTRATVYAEIQREVAAMVARGAPPELIFRAAMLHIRALSGPMTAAAKAVAIGNEMLSDESGE